jgi:hypothetical protein
MCRVLFVMLVLSSAAYSQGVINLQSGSGVPTDTAIGGLLGALIAPMISKGSDAKLVGGLLGAAMGGAYGTAQMQQQQQQQMHQQQLAYEQMQYQQQVMRNTQVMYANMNTSAGGYQDTSHAKMGIKAGNMVCSPYSKFQLDPQSMNLDSGEVVYDPFNGKPFRIP